MNNITKADYFHKKAMTAKLEEDDSNLRELPINFERGVKPAAWGGQPAAGSLSDTEEEVSDLYYDNMWQEEEEPT